MFNEWKLPDGRVIYLLTLEEFHRTPNGTKLISISGEVLTKTPNTDDDTRAGYVAYGLAEQPEPLPDRAIEFEDFEDGQSTPR